MELQKSSYLKVMALTSITEIKGGLIMTVSKTKVIEVTNTITGTKWLFTEGVRATSEELELSVEAIADYCTGKKKFHGGTYQWRFVLSNKEIQDEKERVAKRKQTILAKKASEKADIKQNNNNRG